MDNTSTFPPLASPPWPSRKIPIPIVLAGSIISLGPHWRNCISSYIDPLVKRLSEENYSHPPAPTKLVAYSQLHPALIDPGFSVVEQDEVGNIVADGVIVENSPDDAACRGYRSVIKIIDDHQTIYPDEEFSFYLWHVVAGQHGSWDRKWEIVCGELMKRDVKLSMVFLDDCPIFVKLFSAISPASSHITPWFPTFPDHKFLLSGFIPPVELGGEVPSVVSTAHAATSFPVPSTIGVTAWNSPSEFPAHGTRYPDDQSAAPPFSQHPGPDIYAQGPVMAPFLNLYEGPQASDSAVVQSQQYLNLDIMSVPEAQGLAPIGCQCPAPPHRSGVEQQQPAPHNDTEKFDSHDDFANANAGPMSSGPSDEMRDNEWTRTLNLNDTCVPVRALMADAVGDPKLSNWPNELEVELAVGLKLSILAIQEWIRKNKAPMVRLSYVDGTNNSDFDQLVEKIRAHSYAVVTWENRDRLLLAPLGKALLCAAFPEKENPKRPTFQPPRKVRTAPRDPQRTRKRGPQKKEGPQKKQKQTSRRPQPYLATTPKSSNGLCDERYPETAAQGTITLQHWQPQPEQPQLPHDPQFVMESTGMQGSEIEPSIQWPQNDEFAQRPPPPQFPVEQQTPPGVLAAYGEQLLVDLQMGIVAADCMADPSNVKSEAMDAFEMFQYVNLDGYEV